MKPAFALDFRDDTVSLLHRSSGGWHVVGAVPLDTPDLPEALNYLRSTALGLSPKGLATKLIIPNDQILYTWVHAPGPSADERHAQVMRGLEGRTPYDVADLAFDYKGDGADVLVAVIAKETLAEAEGFAVEHRFNPVSFVAVPEGADFGGEPWFGMTQAAAEVLGQDQTVKRDDEAVVIKTRAGSAVAKPDADTVEEPAPVELPDAEPDLPTAPEQAPPEMPDPIAEPEPVDLPDAPVEIPQPDPEPVVEPEIPAPDLPQPELPEPEIPEPDLPEPEIPEPELPRIDPAPMPEIVTRPVPMSALDERSDRELAARLGNTLSQPIKQPERAEPPAVAPRTPIIEVEEAPMALDVPVDDSFDDEPQGKNAIKAALSAQSVRVTDTVIDDDLPPVPSNAAMVSFNTRRQDAVGAAPTKTAAMGAAPMLGAATAGAARPAVKPVTAASKVQKPAKASGLRGMGAFVGAGTGAKRQKVDLPKASVSAAATLDAPRSGNPSAPARKPLTKGPGGFALREPVRGKPRYLGLILTVVLLFLLAMIAAWSSYSLTGWNILGSAPVQNASSDPAATSDVPDISDEMLA
ncbi:MAG: hypothetical protein ACOH2M_30115, partial [Cypionkella sp.]